MTEQETMQGLRACWEHKDCSKCPFILNLNDCHSELAHEAYKTIERVQAENAAMRKQISEMLTPLCTLGDKLYHYELSFGEGFDENGKVIYTSSMDIIETVVTRDNIWRMCDLVQNKRAFFSREALAASFKERFQKGREQFVKEIKDDKRRTE